MTVCICKVTGNYSCQKMWKVGNNISISQPYRQIIITALKHLAWTSETGWSPCRQRERWAIDNFTWGYDSLLREPSTPGNELPAWYISLTGWDCSGATWYCNSSSSLISHFSSITLPWHAEESLPLSPTRPKCLSMHKHVWKSNCRLFIHCRVGLKSNHFRS